MTPSTPPFDLEKAHRYFSAECFNKSWDLIEKPHRTAAENEQMLLRAIASLWHWTQRSDCTARNLSIGQWQVSRVFALLGDAKNAKHFAQNSLEHAKDDTPFYRGYAHEALARAAMLAGDKESMEKQLALARENAAGCADAEERKMLEKDLENIRL